MNPFLQRAQLLIQQSRFELAETELQQALIQDPDNALAHALLAICFTDQEKFKDATRASETAIGLAPDSAYSYYVASLVSDARNQLAKAENEIQHAIAIDHEDADFFAQLSQLKIQQRKWTAALDAAETGLEMAPEHVACTNLRAMAMVKLGKPVEANASIQAAMEKSPNDGFSHANKAWALLEQGKPKESMPHFREALRLEPDMEWARAGIVESMKSQYLIYRLMLGWFFWASRLEGRTLTLILIGGFIGANFTSTLADKVPFLQPFLLPIIIAYIGFVVMTWVSVPLFNLLLRFNKFGRLVLSTEEKTTSTWVAVCLLLAFTFVILTFVTGYNFFLGAAIVTAVMTPLIGTYYSSDEGWPRVTHGLLLTGFSIFAAVIVGLTICGYFSRDGLQKACQGLLIFLNTPLIVLAIGSQFAANFLTMAKPTRGTDQAKMVRIIGGIALAIATVLFLGFIALVLSFSSQLNQASSGLPVRISLTRLAADQSNFKNEADSLFKELIELGFTAGDCFACPELNDTHIQYFLHKDGVTGASVTEATAGAELVVSMVSTFGDDRVLLVTNQDVFIVEPDNIKSHVALAPLTQMLATLRDKLKQEEGKPIRLTMDDLPELQKEIYARKYDFMLERGGPTKDELRAKTGGTLLSDEAITNSQLRWQKDSQQNVEQFVIEKFLDQNPKFASQQDRLICVNRFDVASHLGPNFPLRLLPYFKASTDLPQVSEILKQTPYQTRIEGLHKLLDPNRLKRVGQTEVPIKTDIYLKADAMP